MKKKYVLALIIVLFFIFIFDDNPVSRNILFSIFPPASTRDAYFLNETQINELSQKALNGDDKAALRLANFYMFAEYNDQESIKWLTIAARQGNLMAHSSLALMLIQSNRKSEAMEWLIKAAEKGYIDAQSRLSDLYLEQGDTDKAIYWLTLAAGGGTNPSSNPSMMVIAQLNLGELLLAEGRTDEAIKWLTTASENGHSKAPYALAQVLFRENKLEEATKWAKYATRYESTRDDGEKLIKEIETRNNKN